MIAEKIDENKTDSFLKFMAFEKLYANFSKQNFINKQCFTNREKEIIQLLSLGLNSYEIANKLFISKHTVNTHRKNIYKKGEFNSLRDVILFSLFN